MKFATPFRFSKYFYLALNTNAYPGDEKFGLGVYRLYLGYYVQLDSIGGFGITNQDGCL